mgnify:FL=1
MREIQFEEMKKIELNILTYFTEVCEENNLRYYLGGGTLLGAVRHKGFIPWDDDIDVMMPRPDFQKFLSLSINNKNYNIIKPGTAGYYYNFAKLVDTRTILEEKGIKLIDGLGVYIDIFPLDGMPETPDARKKRFKELNSIRKRINNTCLLRPKFHRNPFAYLNACRIYNSNKNIDLSSLQKKYLDSALKNSFDDSEFVFAAGGAYGARDIFPGKWFEKEIELQFENLSVKAFNGYDFYLTQLYGDYMTLPPEDKRVTPHHTIVYFK